MLEYFDEFHFGEMDDPDYQITIFASGKQRKCVIVVRKTMTIGGLKLDIKDETRGLLLALP